MCMCVKNKMIVSRETFWIALNVMYIIFIVQFGCLVNFSILFWFDVYMYNVFMNHAMLYYGKLKGFACMIKY